MHYFYWGATYLSYVILFITLSAGILFHKHLSRITRILFGYLFLVFTIQLIAWGMIQLDMSNLSIFPVYVGIEFFLLSWFILELNSHKKIQPWMLILPALAIIAEGFLKLDSQGSLYFGKSISNILIVVGTGYYLLKSLKTNVYVKRRLRFLMYAVFFYFSMSLVLFFFVLELNKINLDMAYFIWGIHNVILCVFYLNCFYFIVNAWK